MVHSRLDDDDDDGHPSTCTQQLACEAKQREDVARSLKKVIWELRKSPNTELSEPIIWAWRWLHGWMAGVPSTRMELGAAPPMSEARFMESFESRHSMHDTTQAVVRATPAKLVEIQETGRDSRREKRVSIHPSTFARWIRCRKVHDRHTDRERERKRFFCTRGCTVPNNAREEFRV